MHLQEVAVLENEMRGFDYKVLLQQLEKILQNLNGGYVFRQTDELILELNYILWKVQVIVVNSLIYEDKDVLVTNLVRDIRDLVEKLNPQDEQLQFIHFTYLRRYYPSYHRRVQDMRYINRLKQEFIKQVDRFGKKYNDDIYFTRDKSELQRAVFINQEFFKKREVGNEDRGENNEVCSQQMYYDSKQMWEIYKTFESDNGLLIYDMMFASVLQTIKLKKEGGYQEQKEYLQKLIDKFCGMYEKLVLGWNDNYMGLLPNIKYYQFYLFIERGSQDTRQIDEDWYNNYFWPSFKTVWKPCDKKLLKYKILINHNLTISQMVNNLGLALQLKPFNDDEVFNYVYNGGSIINYCKSEIQSQAANYWPWLLELYTIRSVVGEYIYSHYKQKDEAGKKELLSYIYKNELVNINRLTYLLDNKLNFPCDVLHYMYSQVVQEGGGVDVGGDLDKPLLTVTNNWSRVRMGFFSHMKRLENCKLQILNNKIGLDNKYRVEIQREILNLQVRSDFQLISQPFKNTNKLNSQDIVDLMQQEEGVFDPIQCIEKAVQYRFKQLEKGHAFEFTYYRNLYMLGSKLIQEGFDMTPFYYKTFSYISLNYMINTANLFYYMQRYQMAYTLFKYALHILKMVIKKKKEAIITAMDIYGQMINCLLQGGEIYEYDEDDKFHFNCNIDKKNFVYEFGLQVRGEAMNQQQDLCEGYGLQTLFAENKSYHLLNKSVAGVYEKQQLQKVDKDAKIQQLISEGWKIYEQTEGGYIENKICGQGTFYIFATFDYWFGRGDKEKAYDIISHIRNQQYYKMIDRQILQFYECRFYLMSAYKGFQRDTNIALPKIVQQLMQRIGAKADYKQKKMYVEELIVKLQDYSIVDHTILYQLFELLQKGWQVDQGFYQTILQLCNQVRWVYSNLHLLHRPKSLSYEKSELIRMIYSLKPLHFNHNLQILKNQEVSPIYKEHIDSHKTFLKILLTKYENRVPQLTKHLLLFTFREQMWEFTNPSHIKAYKKFTTKNGYNKISNSIFVLSLILPDGEFPDLSRFQYLVRYQWSTDFDNDNQSFKKQILVDLYDELFQKL